jgi:uncharacterized membrane protein
MPHYLTDALSSVGKLGLLLSEYRHDGEGWHEYGGFGTVEVLILLLFWGGLVALIAWLVVRIFPKDRGDARPGAPRNRAEEILRERFARGEITAEEYERALEVLRTGIVRGTSEDQRGERGR